MDRGKDGERWWLLVDSFRRFSCGQRFPGQKPDVRSTLHRARIFYQADSSIGSASLVVTLDFVGTPFVPVFSSPSPHLIPNPPCSGSVGEIVQGRNSVCTSAPITCRSINWLQKTKLACKCAPFPRGLVMVIIEGSRVCDDSFWWIYVWDVVCADDRATFLRRKLTNCGRA